MSAVIYTARRGSLGALLTDEVKRLLESCEGDVYVVVPNQLTLETEMRLLDELKLNGSFRLNVLSPKRLCGLVFEEKGYPEGTVIDERGRAMLMGYLLKQNEDSLKWYKASSSKAGFELRIVEEIKRLRQAGVSAEQLKAYINDEMDDRLRAKLNDLNVLYELYERRMGDLVQDGESEINAAVEKMGGCEALKRSSAVIYGFDITTASVNRLIAGIAGACRETIVFVPLPCDGTKDDSIYEPLKRALERLTAELEQCGAKYKVIAPKPKESPANAQRAIRRLYSASSEKIKLKGGEVSAWQLRNPLDEARFVASDIRKSVKDLGLSYKDINVIVNDIEAHEDVISCAFKEYGVPYFMQSSASLSSHPLCRFLSESLSLIAGRSNGIGALLETGFTSLSQIEQEALIDYYEKLNLRPTALMRPFVRGSAEMIAEAEPLRQKLINPIIALREDIKAADTLEYQLKRVYEYLKSTGTFEAYADYIDELKLDGETALANDGVRIGNLLIDTFDQMNELLGPKPLSLSAIGDLISRALDAAIVKLLPQSPDAVQITGPQRSGNKEVKIAYLMHAVSSAASEQSGVFDDMELKQVSEAAGKYLAPSLIDLAKTERMYIKDALSLATDRVVVTFPSGNMDGSALMSGTVISELKRAIDGFTVKGGVDNDDETGKLRLTSQKGAISYISAELSSIKPNPQIATALKLMQGDGKLERLTYAAAYTNQSDNLNSATAQRLYREGSSVSRLERYAACPFSHFVEQGLRPVIRRDFKIDPLNRGVLLHECVELFMKSKGIADGGEEEAVLRMEKIFDKALDGELAPYVRDTNSAAFQAETLKRAAKRAARLLFRQLNKGVFRPVEMEAGFGLGGKGYVKVGDARLGGRIDRVDMGVHDGKKYVFIVDYKSGGAKIDPKQILAGLQLQLLVYLSVALTKYGAGSAGVYYFHVGDEPIRDESSDPYEIERKRTSQMRMNGIAPSDVSLLRAISDEPENVINVDFKTDGSLKAGAHADKSEFENLVSYALKQCEAFAKRISEGDTSVSPATGSNVDACKYCKYAEVCLKDRQIDGTKKRRLKTLSFSALINEIDCV